MGEFTVSVLNGRIKNSDIYCASKPESSIKQGQNFALSWFNIFVRVCNKKSASWTVAWSKEPKNK